MMQTYKDKILHLKKIRQQALENKTKKLGIVILGAGPAGLIRAIQGLLEGHTIQIIEKRSASHPGRHNVVSLIKASMELLKEYGVFNYLLENNLVREVDEPLSIFVKLSDLERSLKQMI